MNATIPSIGAAVQSIAYLCAALSVWGWVFWLGAVYSDVTLAQLRIDPEFDSMIAITDMLSYLAPLALIFGLASLWWRPRYLGATAAVIGMIGTWWLSLGAEMT